MLQRIRKSATWVQLTNWEFWPTKIHYIPIISYALLKSIQAGSPFYYFSTNPGIETGGMIIESKYDILKQFPEEYIPKTIIIEYKTPLKEIKQLMKKERIDYPIIIKPNYGERGQLVEKAHNEAELEEFFHLHQGLHMDFLIQEYIDYDIEASVFYYRYPNEKRGRVTSFIIKETLSVLGNGKDTIEALLKNHRRGQLQLKRLRLHKPELLQCTPAKNERVEVVPVGSHNLGSKFINKSYLIDEKMHRFYDALSKHVKGFYFGRYDVRAQSIQSVIEGRIKILELNGAKAEPLHIYHPKYPVMKAYKEWIHHWRAMYRISRMNHKRGHKYPKFHEGWSALQKWKRHHKKRY